MIFKNDKVFDFLKWVDLTMIPALIVFLGVILPLFNCTYTNVILTVLGAFDVFLGTLLGISSKRFNNTDSDETKEE